MMHWFRLFPLPIKPFLECYYLLKCKSLLAKRAGIVKALFLKPLTVTVVTVVWFVMQWNIMKATQWCNIANMLCLFDLWGMTPLTIHLSVFTREVELTGGNDHYGNFVLTVTILCNYFIRGPTCLKTW